MFVSDFELMPVHSAVVVEITGRAEMTELFDMSFAFLQ